MNSLPYSHQHLHNGIRHNEIDMLSIVWFDKYPNATNVSHNIVNQHLALSINRFSNVEFNNENNEDQAGTATGVNQLFQKREFVSSMRCLRPQYLGWKLQSTI